jgi:rubrerythrin
MESEVKAYEFYDSALAEITDAEVRELFLELRDEEAKHQTLIHQIVAKLPEDEGFDPDDFVDEPAAQ